MRWSIAFILAAAAAAQPAITDAQRIANWREDLRFFAASLHGTPIEGEKSLPGQKDLPKLYPHLDQDMAALDAELPTLRDEAIGWRLERILATARVGHNLLYPGDTQLLPLAFEWLGPDLVVTYAGQGFEKAVATRVVRIGSLTAAQFLDAISPYISYETDEWRRAVAGQVMRQRSLLTLLGVVEDDRVRLSLEAPDGPMDLALPFAPSNTRLNSFWEVFGKPVLLALSHPQDNYYWREYLPDSQTLYIQYRQCADDPKLAFKDFAAATLSEIDRRKPRRVIVDLRFNGGGNSRILEPLTEGLSKRRKIVGGPVVLIGPNTFSSGVISAQQLRDAAKARLVGIATGGLLGGYGESPRRTLPHSRLGFQWTIKERGRAQAVRPDVASVLTPEDLRAGRDAVLETALGL